MMDELRRFIKLDKHEAVKIGDLEKCSVVLHVVGSNFNKEDFPEAAVRERVEELTRRRGEERHAAHLYRQHQCGGQKMEATASGRGLARSLPSHLQRRLKERSRLVACRAVNRRHLGARLSTKTMWKSWEAKEKENAYYDQDS